MVMAWYHPQGAAPLYALPDVPECTNPEWVGPFSTGHTIRTCLQEMAENTADAAHFVTIHRHPGQAHYDDFQLRRPVDDHASTQKFPSSHGPVEGTLNIDTAGFGFAIVRYRTLVEICMVTTTVPVDAETSQQHNHVWYRNPARDPKIDRIGQAFIKEVNRQFTDDIPIWENKIYLEKPQPLRRRRSDRAFPQVGAAVLRRRGLIALVDTLPVASRAPGTVERGVGARDHAPIQTALPMLAAAGRAA